MSARPTGEQYDRLLDIILPWHEAERAKNIDFYKNALIKNELSVKLNREFTTRTAECKICCMKQKPGIRQYWYKENHDYELHCWFTPICENCWSELILSASLDELFIAQIPQTVISSTAI